MRLRKYFAATLGVLGLAAAGAAIAESVTPGTTGTVAACIGDDCSYDPSTGLFSGGVNGVLPFAIEPDGTFETPFPNLVGPEGESISASTSNGDVDPFQNLALAASDPESPTSFGFAVSAPLVPELDGPVDYITSISGSCTDAQNDPDTSCGASPFGIAGHTAEYFVNGTSISMTDIDDSVDVGAQGASGVLGADNLTGSLDCDALGGCSTFSTYASFGATGGGDVVSINTGFQLAPQQASVAEPGVLGMLGLGLIGTAAVGRTRSARTRA